MKLIKVKLKRILAIILTAMVVTGVTPQQASADDTPSTSEPSGDWSSDTAALTGTGTVGSNYLISSPEQLAYAATMVNAGDPAYIEAYYTLTNDIDISEHYWIPIGTYDCPFCGSFYGDGHKITGLTIGSASNPTAIEYAGLFGDVCEPAVIDSVNVIGAAIYTTFNGLDNFYCGGLVGRNEYGMISNCSASVNLITNNCAWACVGGLVGSNMGSVSNCYTTGTVNSGPISNVGGIAGENFGSDKYGYVDISNCSTGCNVIGGIGSSAGGFVGNNAFGFVYNSYAIGIVTGGWPDAGTASYTGGFAGYNYQTGYICNCYATGDVAGGGYLAGPPPHKALVGGFIGKNYGKIYNCYAVGNVTGDIDATLGGFTGGGDPTNFINTYWNRNAVQTVGGVVRAITANGEQTTQDLSGGITATIMKGGAPGAGILYSNDKGQALSDIGMGAFHRVLNDGINAIKTSGIDEISSLLYLDWIEDTKGLHGGYPLLSSDCMPIPQYNITVQNDGNGTASADMLSAEPGTMIELSETPAHGYHFKEWLVMSPASLNITNNSFTMPNSAVTMKAIFEADTYSIVVQNDGNGNAAASCDAAVKGDYVTLSAAPSAGYHFKSWQVINPEGLNITGNGFSMPEEAVTVKAIFEVNPPDTYSVTVLNDGHGSAASDVTSSVSGAAITLSVSPSAGYHFKEWQVISPVGLSVSGSSFSMPQEAVTIKAIFEAEVSIPDTYSIIFNNDGVTYAVTTVSGGAYAGISNWPSNPVKPGFTFAGWYTGPNGTGSLINYDTVITTNITVYVRWIQNTGNGNNNNNNYSFTPAVNLPTIEGNAAQGWSSIQDALQTGSEDNLIINMNGNTVVPQEILETLKGKDISVVFKLADGIEWMINGKDINEDITDNKGDINLQVNRNTSNVPEALIRNLPESDNHPFQLSLVHEGSLGFAATLHINLKKENQGRMAYLYYYDPFANELRLQSMSQINEDGTADYIFNHASDYVILVDDGSICSELMNQIKVTSQDQTLYIGGNTGKTANIEVKLPEALQKMVAEGSNPYTVTYTSSDPSKASVSSSGKVTALNSGKTSITIQVTINGIEKRFTKNITVKKAFIKLTRKTKSMKIGKTYVFQAKGYGVDTAKLTWATTEKSVVVINRKTGEAAAKAAGADYIIVKSGNVYIKIKVVVE